MSTPNRIDLGLPIPAAAIRVLCGWCEGAAERTEQLRAQGYAVSHTICPLCLVKVRAAQVPQVQP